MLIIVCGADGNGKSTLVDQLALDTGLPIFRSGGPKTGEAMLDMLADLERMAKSEQSYICDRVPYISEVIYSAALNRQPVVDIETLYGYYQIPQKIIYCRMADQKQALANMSRAFKAHKPKEHTDLVEKNHEKIAMLYDELFDNVERMGIPLFEYDWKNPDHYQELMWWL